MDVLTKEQLWRCFLSKKPMPELKETEYRGYFFSRGFFVYLTFFRDYPAQALKEVIGCALILVLMFGALWFKEIILWIEGVLR